MSVSAAPAPPALSAYTAGQLGPDRAALASALRARLWAAGLRWPAWIDARPGRLQVLIGDCAADPPLGGASASAASRYGTRVLAGLGAFGLATGVPRLALATPDPVLRRQLEALCRKSGQAVEVRETPAAYPAQPELDFPEARGRTFCVPAEQLLRAGALVESAPPPRLCAVSGAVQAPQVLDLAELAATDAAGPTPRELAARCGGTDSAAWVALCGGPLGALWPADDPLPADVQHVLILPVAHPLVRRHRETDLARAATACAGCRLCTEYCPEAQRGLPLDPAALMRAAGSTGCALPAGVDPRTAHACTGCGACSAMCPAELLPGRLLTALRGTPALAALAPPPTPEPPPPGDPARRLPRALVLARLGLAGFAAPAL